ncbi:MAG TPA: hypothetical protein VGW10_12470 [Solirubrobacteraceae bacterium]|nr:hypothetical protein [Solirubrobacteraceae bacterium]
MTLAYVFWHWPGDAYGYEERMQAFHTALARPGSVTFRLQRAPWNSHEPQGPYEDWYPVRDWAGIGELNDRAVTGAREEPHDIVAALSRRGAGAIYRHIAGDLPLDQVTFAAWTDQRPDVDATIWQRQLVLGPAPEYAVLAASPVEAGAGAVLTRPRLVASA